MRILITGSSGFIGTELWSFLHRQKRKFKIFGMTGGPSHVPADHIFGCRLSDRPRLGKIISSIRPDCIIHLAGGRMADDSETFESNFVGTRSLFEILEKSGLKKTRVVIPGTAAEYGHIKGPALVREKVIPRPVNWYGAVKNMQVNLGLWYARRGFDVVVGRVFNILGYGTPLELAMGQFASDIVALEKMPGRKVLTTGYLGNHRDYLDIEDVCSALLALAQKGRSGEVYNICSGRRYTMRQLLHRLIKCSGVRNLVVQEKKGSPVPSCNAAGSNAKIRRATGWKRRVSLDESLINTLKFYRESDQPHNP